MADSNRLQYITSRDGVPPAGRDHYDAIAESRGGVSGPFAVLLHSPELAGRVGDLGHYVRFDGELPGSIRELAILATARATDCAFEWASHEPIARDAGVRPEAIDVVASEADTDGLTDEEATVIEYARELLETNRVSDATFETSHERFGDAGVVELTATIGYYLMISTVLNAFEVLPDDDTPVS